MFIDLFNFRKSIIFLRNLCFEFVRSKSRLENAGKAKNVSGEAMTLFPWLWPCRCALLLYNRGGLRHWDV